MKKAFLVHTPETNLDDEIFVEIAIKTKTKFHYKNDEMTLKENTCEMLMHDFVVTTMDWSNDPDNVAMVNIARMAGMEVKSLIAVMNDIQRGNTKN